MVWEGMKASTEVLDSDPREATNILNFLVTN
jgi:hypothetical protein